jgi:hypothetical protein
MSDGPTDGGLALAAAAACPGRVLSLPSGTTVVEDADDEVRPS